MSFASITLLFLLVILTNLGCVPQGAWPSPLFVRSTTKPISTFEQLWVRSNVIMEGYGGTERRLLVERERVLLTGILEQRQGFSLISMELGTGKVLWSEPTSPGSEIVSNSSHVFMETGVTGAITAYQLETGKSEWQTHLPNTRSVSHLSATEALLSAKGVPDTFVLLNAKTGAVEASYNSIQKPYVGFLFHLVEPSTAYLLRSNSVQVVNLETEHGIWKTSIDEELDQPPLIENETILIRTDKIIGRAYALDSSSGDLLWRSEQNIISNIAMSGSIAYFVTEEAKLLAVNNRTGDVIATLEFTPAEVVVRDDAGYGRGFYVAAIGEVVIVYFGDSQQLFGFRFVPTL